MRHLVLSLVALSLCASCKLQKLASVVSFEGEIEMATTMPLVSTKPITITMKMKGAKMRTETGSFGGVSITDGDAKKMWTLDPWAHTYMETDLAAAAKVASATKSKATMKATKTSRSDKVAGYSCDVYELVDSTAPSSPIELCVASGLSMVALGLSGPFAAFASAGDAWGDVMSHGFPLRVMMRDPGGKLLMTMEATRIERKTEPDSEFEVPAGYTKTASSI